MSRLCYAGLLFGLFGGTNIHLLARTLRARPFCPIILLRLLCLYLHLLHLYLHLLYLYLHLLYL